MGITQNVPFDERKYTSFERERRSTIRALAKKFSVDVDLEGKKEDMLPIMEQARKRGVFDRDPPVIEPPKPPEYDVEHMGVKRKWCVLDGDNIHQSGYDSKDEALASIA